MAAAPQWVEVARGVLAIAQAVAIVIGASWAYFKFVRGRTFAERLEASVEATPFRRADTSALRIRGTMTNTGASRVGLKDNRKVVYVYAAAADTTPGVNFKWRKHLSISLIFTQHKWIEAQETVSDELLVAVPESASLAYRVELIVASKKKKRWSATAIVPAVKPEEARNQMQTQERAEQGPLTTEEEQKMDEDLEEQKLIDDEEERNQRQEKKTNNPKP